MTTKQNIEKVLWSACDSFRGKIDSSRYKDYILSMLFVKYLSDVYAYTRKKYSAQYNGNEERIQRAMRRERFVMDETSTFEEMGKTMGKDKEEGKLTYTSLYGLEKAKKDLNDLIDKCYDILNRNNLKSEVFEQILEKIRIK